MSNHEELNAMRLDRALRSPEDIEGRLDEELRGVKKDEMAGDKPYLSVAQALRDDASKQETMDPEVMARQKDHLAIMAKNLKAQRAATSTTTTTRVTQSKRPWYLWAGAFAAVTAVALLVFVAQTSPTPWKNAARNAAGQLGSATLSLIVPEAYASDAFTVFAENKTAGGASVDTTFKVTAKMPVDETALKQSLRIVAADEASATTVDVPYDVERQDDRTFRLKPTQKLDAGAVYKVTIATGVKDQQGEVRQRDFSWAIQTQDTFRVLHTVPGDQTTGVPVDTAITFTSSQTNWKDPSSFVSISPDVKGKFETHGRTLVFLPSKPLAAGTIYTVTLKKGWGIDGGSSLDQDKTIRFETEAANSSQDSTFFPYPATLESAPGKTTIVHFQTADRFAGTSVRITGYALQQDGFKQALKSIDSVPSWAYASRNNIAGIDALVKDSSFSTTVNLEKSETDYRYYVRLPEALMQGLYAVKFEVDGASPSWLLLQRTTVAAYAMADRYNIMVWVVDSNNGKPLSGQDVKLEGQTVQTNDQGIARVSTPSAWRDRANGNMEVETRPTSIEVGNSAAWLLLSVTYDAPMWSFGGSAGTSADINNWSYIFPDRPLYRMQDTIQFFGLLQERSSGRGAGALTVELRGADYMLDFGSYDTKVYARRDLNTDAEGFFQGDINWPGSLKPGYYQLAIIKDGSVASSRTVEIRDTAKPAYRVEVQSQATDVYAGDKISGRVRVTFYDGTPFAKAKVILNTSGGFSANKSLNLVTDDGGYAQFEITTDKSTCDLNSDHPSCTARDTLSFEARPDTGEEAEIVAYARVGVWRGHLFLSADAQNKDNGDAEIKARVREVRLDKANGREEDSVLGDGKSDVLVRSNVSEIHWDQIQTGTTFDPIEQKAVPQYRYDRRVVNAGVFESKTAADGVATITFPMKDGVSYQIVTSIVEGDGATHAVVSYASKNNYERSGMDTISLEPTSAADNKNSYKQDESVSLTLMRNGKKLTDGNYLFVRASRGIKMSTAITDATYAFTFGADDVPNVNVYGVTFTPAGFVQAQYTASVDTEDRALKVELSSDQQSYAPGGQVNIRATVTDKNGQPVSGARVALSVTDEALLSLSNLDTTENPLDLIYHWVPDGVLATKMTNAAVADFFGGGAEMGGGERALAVRGNFKDQAAYVIVQSGSDGTATTNFTVPDNITSWRVMSSAVSADRRAGTATLRLPVTKPLFVDAVIPSDVMVGDKPVLKLRAFGSALPNQGNVTYSVSMPTLGIDNQEVQGDAQKAVYVALDKLVPGTHKVTIRVTAYNQTDAIERTVRVVPTHATHDERVAVELAPGSTLPDVGSSREVEVTIASKARTALRSRIESLAQPWSARLESQVAGSMMRKLAKDSFNSTFDSTEPSFARYQRENGGLAMLPYASEDAGLSAKVAAAAPDLFDRSELANYFWTVTDDPKTSREASIQALSGLAALDQPVVDRLHAVAALTNLSWREKLALIRGLDAIGEREAGRQLLDEMLKGAKNQDNIMYVEVSKSKSDTLEATAEAASLAAELAHPSASALIAYVDSNWSDEALTDLDRATYLQRIAPSLPNIDVQVSYMTGQETKTANLKDVPYVTLKLTADEAAAFRALSVNGPAEASFVRQTSGNPPSSPLLTVSRDYRVDGKQAATLHEGDVVKISLAPHWQEKAQDGCYILRDRLPATLVPLVSVSYAPYAPNSVSPYDVLNGEVSFVTCKQNKPEAISYDARVVSLGTYQAEGALLQSMDAPSIAAQSAAQTVEVK